MTYQEIKKLAKDLGFKVVKNSQPNRFNKYDDNDYYMIINLETNLIEPGLESLTLDEVEKWLKD